MDDEYGNMCDYPFCTERAEELESKLRDAIAIIEGLADQQAMADDWYLEPLNRLKEAIL